MSNFPKNKTSYKGVVWTVGGIVIALLLLAWLSSSRQNNKTEATANPNATLQAEETNFNFGAVRINGGNVTHLFKIKNTGTDSVVISRVYTSCMCTNATLIKGNDRIGPFGMLGHGFTPSIDETLKPGEEAGVEAVFDPAAHGPAGLGKISRVVSLENSGKESSNLCPLVSTFFSKPYSFASCNKSLINCGLKRVFSLCRKR